MLYVIALREHIPLEQGLRNRQVKRERGRSNDCFLLIWNQHTS